MTEGIIRTAAGVYVLANDTHLSRYIENAGKLELGAQEISVFQDYVPVGGTVINAGACLGDHASVYANLVGPSGRVWAFEPHPLTWEALQLNMLAYPNVTVMHAALGATALTGHLHQHGNIGASMVTELPANIHTLIDGVKRETPLPTAAIQILPLDILIDQFSRCDLIHLDAEGFEPYILAGAKQILAKFKPVIILEVSGHHLNRSGWSVRALQILLDALGYQFLQLPGESGDECNVLALPFDREPLPLTKTRADYVQEASESPLEPR